MIALTPAGQVAAAIIVDLARLALFAYAIRSGRDFLLRWLETRSGLPLFNTPRPMTKREAIDAARKYGVDGPPPTNDVKQLF
jgi:hypothetical protein